MASSSSTWPSRAAPGISSPSNNSAEPVTADSGASLVGSRSPRDGARTLDPSNHRTPLGGSNGLSLSSSFGPRARMESASGALESPSSLPLASSSSRNLSVATGSFPRSISTSAGMSAAASAYQAVTLTDVLARNNGDSQRALQELLNERNKFCLEAGKLSSENVRIWNLMGRIRKENEGLKSRVVSSASAEGSPGTTGSSNRASPLPASSSLGGHGSQSHGSTTNGTIVPAGGMLPSKRRVPGSEPSRSSPDPTASTSSTPMGASVSADSPQTSLDTPMIRHRTPSNNLDQRIHQGRLSPLQVSNPGSARGSSAGSDRHAPAGNASSTAGHAPTDRSALGSTPIVQQQQQQQAPSAAPTASPPMSPTSAAVMQQRAAAKALQAERSRTTPKASGSTAAPPLSSSSTTVPGMPSTSASMRSLDSRDDYVAVDTDTLAEERSEAGDGEATTVKAAGDERPQLLQTDSNNQFKSSNGPISIAQLKANSPAHQPSFNNASLMNSVDSDSFTDSPQLAARRKDMSSMMGYDGGPSDWSPSRKPASRKASRLEPREATIAPGAPFSAALTEALAAGPPGSRSSLNALPRQPRLDNALLQDANVTVSGTNYRGSSEKGRETVSFYIDVQLDATNASVTKWRVEKPYSDVIALDAKLKHKHGKIGAKKLGGLPLPDKGLFKDHAPSKVDTRKMILEAYFQGLITISLPDKEDICTFLCTDIVPLPEASTAMASSNSAPSSSTALPPPALRKDGFLTKKGQNLGRWVTRFYATSSAERLDYFDGRGGLFLGSINLRGAQIGRQQKAKQQEMDENSYRHAFLILEKRLGVDGASGAEQTKDDGSTQLVRHVLCAESDEARDEWVDVLVRTIAEMERKDKEKSQPTSAAPATAPNGAQGTPPVTRRPSIAGPAVLPASTSRQASVDDAMGPTTTDTMSSPPAYGKTKRSGSVSRKFRKDSIPTAIPGQDDLTTPSSGNLGPTHVGGAQSRDDQGERPALKPSISGPMNGAPIPTGYKFGVREDQPLSPSAGPTTSSSAHHPGETTPRKDEKKRFWHRFGGNAASGNAPATSGSSTTSRAVFGVPLLESIAVSSVSGKLALPSVVYRCIEYLEKTDAVREEGIYRLSGSSAVMKALRDRFNQEGDVDLIASEESINGPKYDPHAIAGLLKTYLRELPASVLTSELHLDFMRVNDILDWKSRMQELSSLVASLPLVNYSLLRTLCKHLIKVISHQEVNKMTMRNVGIVFSPTLGIPAGVFALFLTSFDYCFDVQGVGTALGAFEKYRPTNLSEEEGEQSSISGPGVDGRRPSNAGQQQQQQQPQASEGSRRGAGPSTTTYKSNRNSQLYAESDANRLMEGPMGNYILSANSDFSGNPSSGDVSPNSNGLLLSAMNFGGSSEGREGGGQGGDGRSMNQSTKNGPTMMTV